MIKLNLSSAETGPFALEAIFPVYSPRTRLSLLKQRSTPPVVNCPNLFKRSLEINSLCSIETTTRDYVEFFLYFCQSLAGFGTCKFLLTQYQSNTFLATWPYFGVYWTWGSVVGSWGHPLARMSTMTGFWSFWIGSGWLNPSKFGPIKRKKVNTKKIIKQITPNNP